MSRDLDPALGTKTRMLSADHCLKAARSLYPTATMEIIDARQRIFWVGPEMVGYAWGLKSVSNNYWMRLKALAPKVA